MSRIGNHWLRDMHLLWLGGPGSGNPNQPRDEDGEWTSTGGADGKTKPPRKRTAAQKKMAASLQKLEAFPSVIGKELKDDHMVQTFLSYLMQETYANSEKGDAKGYTSKNPPRWLRNLLGNEREETDFGDAAQNLQESLTELVDQQKFNMGKPPEFEAFRQLVKERYFRPKVR